MFARVLVSFVTIMNYLRSWTGKDETFGSQFWYFQSMINWPCGSGPTVRQHVTTGAQSRAKQFVPWLENKHKRRGLGFQNHPLQKHIPNNLKISRQAPLSKAAQPHENRAANTWVFGRHSNAQAAAIRILLTSVRNEKRPQWNHMAPIK